MKGSRVLHFLRTAVRWLIPVIILTVVFSRIDFNQLKSNVAVTNVWLLLLGILLFPVITILGGIRWHVMLQSYSTEKLSRSFLLRTYWVGMALGIFVPASLGWDIYRIVAASRRYGKPIANIFTVFLEKGLALITMAVLVVVLYPFVHKHLAISSTHITTIVRFSYISIAAFFLLGLILYLIFRSSAASILAGRIDRAFNRFLTAVAARTRLKLAPTDNSFSTRELLSPLSRPGNYIRVLLLSFVIQFVSALAGQVFLLSLGYSFPFVVNLFLIPVFFLIFILPISFGSLGVREGSYILLYGLFGVPAETALLVSFYGLLGLLTSVAVGGMSILFDGTPKGWVRRVHPDDSPSETEE